MSEGKKLVISVLVVVAGVIGTGAWVGLGVSECSELDKIIVVKKTELEKLEKKVSAIPGLKKEKAKLADELDTIEEILPKQRELNKLFDTLSDLKNAVNKGRSKGRMALASLAPLRDKRLTNAPVTSYNKTSYSLSLSADYFSLIKFLNLLENHNRFIQVDSFSIKQKDEGSVINDVNLKLSTFIYDPKSKSTTTKRRRPRRRKKTAVKKTKKVRAVPFDVKVELASRYVYEPYGKARDPFSNPLTKPIENLGFKDIKPGRLMEPEEEKALVRKVTNKLKTIGAMIDREALEEGETALREAEKYLHANFRDRACLKMAADCKDRIRQYRIMINAAQGEKLYKMVSTKYDLMFKAFNEGDYETVYRLNEDVQNMVQLPENKAAKSKVKKKSPRGKPTDSNSTKIPDLPRALVPDKRVIALARECAQLCRRAEARQEFASVTIKIQGTFWSKGEKKSRNRSAVIINNRMFGEGEALDADIKSKSPNGAEKIYIKKITRGKVTFSYKGELIDRVQYTVN